MWEGARRRRPEEPVLIAVGDGGEVETRSWADLARRSRGVAGALSAKGIGRGDRVLLVLENTATFFECWFGVMGAGAAAVCVSPRLAPAEISHVAGDAAPRLAVVADAALPALAGALSAVPAVVAESEADRLDSGEGGPAPVPPDPADPALVLYTSGSTGRPKGAVITGRSLAFAAERMRQSLPLSPADRSLVSLPVSHVNALAYSTMPALAAGATLVVMKRFSARTFLDVAREHRATVASLSTAALRILLGRAPGSADRAHCLRAVGCGSRWREVEERFGVSTVGWYGTTETVIPPLVTPAGAPFGSCGQPARGYDVRLDESGRLHIHGKRGLSLFTGYLGEPAAGSDWLDTGDRLRRDEEGHFFFVGRDHDVLRVGGENVAAAEIELVLLADPGVLEVAVVGAPDVILGEVPVAFVLPREGKDVDREELAALCRRELAPWKVPRWIEVRQELPRVTLDKVDKRALRVEVGWSRED